MAARSRGFFAARPDWAAKPALTAWRYHPLAVVGRVEETSELSQLAEEQASAMSFLARHFNDLLGMDWQTLVVIAVLCGFASYFIKEYLATPPLIIFLYPLLVLFSVLTQYLFTQIELFPPKKLDQWLMWTIMASICGTIIGTCLVAGMITLRERLGGRRA
jgi:hypothetical protein